MELQHGACYLAILAHLQHWSGALLANGILTHKLTLMYQAIVDSKTAGQQSYDLAVDNPALSPACTFPRTPRSCCPAVFTARAQCKWLRLKPWLIKQ